MLIRSHSRGSHDPGFGSRGGSESFDRSAPAQIARKVLGGDAVEAPDPFFESAMVGVHVVDVMFGRLRLWVSGSGQHSLSLARRANAVMADPPSQQKSVDGVI